MPDNGKPVDITLGEVWRGLTALQITVTHFDESLRQIRDDLRAELTSITELRLEALSERLRRVEKIVYGVMGLVGSSVVVAILALVIDSRRH